MPALTDEDRQEVARLKALYGVAYLRTRLEGGVVVTTVLNPVFVIVRLGSKDRPTYYEYAHPLEPVEHIPADEMRRAE